jgi:CubicO group peptidase (beta-lactamase class C family)
MSRKPIRSFLALASLSIAALPAFAEPLPTAKPEQVGMSSQRLGRIAPMLKQEIDAGRLPGAVVLIARKGKLVYSETIGFQDKAAGTPMKADAVFRIYSMTKPLVSVAAMILVEEGKLLLTDPLSKFFPACKNMMVSVPRADSVYARVTYNLVPADREITVQDLLRHTSGIAYGEITQNAPVRDAYAKAGLYQPGVRDYDSRDLTPAEFVDRLCKAPLAQQPGTMWEYSLSVDMLGRVVEAASGQRLADFLDERVIKPLKMVDTGFWLPKEKLSRLAQPLAIDAATGAKVNVIDVSAQPKNDSGGAGGVSTASDYLRFTQMMLNGGQLDGQRILSRTTVALMTSDHLGTRIATPTQPGELLLGVPGYTYGLGFTVRQGPGVAGVPGSQGEFMWAGYAGTYFWVDPKEELAVVYMTQAPSPIRGMYRRLLKQLVYQAIVD